MNRARNVVESQRRSDGPPPSAALVSRRRVARRGLPVPSAVAASIARAGGDGAAPAHRSSRWVAAPELAGVGAGALGRRPARDASSARRATSREWSSSGLRQAHHRDFEHDDLLRGTLHLTHGAPYGLEDPHRARQSELPAPLNRRSRSASTASATSGATCSRKTWRTSPAKFSASCSGSHPSRASTARERSAPTASSSTNAAKSPSNCGRRLVERARGEELVQGAQRVARRTAPQTHRGVDGRVVGRRGPPRRCTSCSSVASVSAPSRRNSRCWVRERMVGRTLCGSVVASTKTTCGGGSSRVFSSAADAALESWWTSSKM